MRNGVSFDQETYESFMGNDYLPKLRSGKNWQLGAEDLSGFMAMSDGVGSTKDESLAKREFSLGMPEFKSEFLKKVSHLRDEKYLMDANLKPAYQSVFLTQKDRQEFSMKPNMPDASL